MKTKKVLPKTNYVRRYIAGSALFVVLGSLLVLAAASQSRPQLQTKPAAYHHKSAVTYRAHTYMQHLAGLAPAGSPAPAKATANSAAPAPTPAAASKPTATSTASSTSKATGPPPTPAATPAPTPAPAASNDIASETQCPGQSAIASVSAVLTCLTSFARQAHGLNSVAANQSLVAAATSKAQDIHDCGFSHTACGRAFNYWFGASGYTGRCQAENIAQGQRSLNEVFVAWMNSPGHRANIMNASYNAIGVAELDSSQGPIWVMELGGC